MATTTFKRRLGLFLALLGLLASHSFLAYSTYNLGMETGLDAYHGMCYHVGGYVVDEAGRVVQCQPMTQLPKAELDNFLKT